LQRLPNQSGKKLPLQPQICKKKLVRYFQLRFNLQFRPTALL
jgi:hypothetical protein